MYSIVLVMAVTAGGETPDFGRRGCHGCHGCYGCYGCRGCYGCWRYGCYGCCGGSGCCGTVVSSGCCGGQATTDQKPQKPQKEEMKQGSDQGSGQVSDQVSRLAPARFIVRLQPDARLTVDGERTRSTSAVRTFETPALKVGKSYVYTLKAEFQQDGETKTVTKQVKVLPGRTIQVDLREEDVAVVSK